jgi:chromosome segregation ATPase
VRGLNEKTDKIQEANTILTHDAEMIQKKDKELEEIKSKLEKKNAELEKVLEDFYTIRIGMQRDMEAGKLEEENKKIKEQLDKLKS